MVCFVFSKLAAVVRVEFGLLDHRHSEGSLSKAQPSLADLLSLQKPASAATLLFVVNASSGMLAGEAVFDSAQLSALDMNVRANLLQVWVTAPVRAHVVCIQICKPIWSSLISSLRVCHTTALSYMI